MHSPLPMKRTLLYCSVSAGLNIMAISVCTWIVYFYSPPPDYRDIFLPITLVGVRMTITPLWDAIINPMIGHFSDITRSRWGRRQLFFLFVTTLTAILQWRCNQLSPGVNLVNFGGRSTWRSPTSNLS